MSRKTKTTLTLAILIIGLMMLGLATVFASPSGVSTLGDFVWFDENGNGIKDEGPEWGDSGIDGVLVNLYLDDGDGVFEPGTDDALWKSMTTGDNPTTTEVEHGWYDFTELGDHLGWWVEIADSNFEPGGPLEGYEYTGNNAFQDYNGSEPRYTYIPVTLTDINNVDFSYTLKDIVSVGNLVWHDPDNDGLYEPDDGEEGINGITVYLFHDADGDGIPEPEGDDSMVISTTTTAMTIDGQTYDGIYQFLNLSPSMPGKDDTNYFVAISVADLLAQGYTYSSSGYSLYPLDNEDADDGYPLSTTLLRTTSDDPQSITASTYVVSKPFSLTVGGQSASLATTDWGDAAGYTDTSSYMTVDFGFFQNGPTAVTLTAMHTRDMATGDAFLLGASMVLVGLMGLGAFAWRKRFH